MHQKEIAKALAVAMKRDGYELDGCDSRIILTTVSKAIASQRHREDNARSSSYTFIWCKPTPRRCR